MPKQTQAPRLPIEELARYPLLSALFGRRARRFGVGMRIPDGPLAFESKRPPQPLSDTERALLILIGSGVSGWNFGMPHTESGTPDTGCNYPVRLVGRTYPSAAGIHASELLITDDSGSYITQFRDLDPQRLQEYRGLDDFDHLLAIVREHTVKLSPIRAEVPAEMPHIEFHNYWSAHRPGSTLFAPIVDLTQQQLDFLIIQIGMGSVLFDSYNQRPCGDLEPFVRSGLLNAEARLELADLEQYVLSTASVEIGVLAYNIALALQAMGLGGWMYSGINPASFLGAFAGQGVRGIGFRYTERAGWSAPNPVGLDRYFETCSPPFSADMNQAVDRFVAIKFGPGGTFDPDRPGPFRDNRGVKERIDRYQPQVIECLKVASSYIYETYGRFPGTLPTVLARMYTQAQHIDLDFYDTFYGPGACLETHHNHQEKWHPIEGEPQP